MKIKIKTNKYIFDYAHLTLFERRVLNSDPHYRVQMGIMRAFREAARLNKLRGSIDGTPIIIR